MTTRRRARRLGPWLLLALFLPGCATMRRHADDPDLRPASDGFADTADGWHLGIRHIRPERPDPGKLPVVLCHGMGLNSTFWTITGGNHLPRQLAARGYEVFIVDLRGSGASHRDGVVGVVNRGLRETPLLEFGEGRWTMDDEANYDVPAVLDYVARATGKDRVNWVGHSLGGMLMLAYLETSDHPERIANFVAMGSPATLAPAPHTELLRANKGLRLLLRGISTGRIARPMMYVRLPGLERIDRFYYTAVNVDRRTIERFYGYTLENPGRGALRQLEVYLRTGHLVSADGTFDYANNLNRVTTPILVVAGEGDLLADIPSTLSTYYALGSKDRTLARYGRQDGHHADYGHCDLVWSRFAPTEIFPDVGAWLDRRQPGSGSDGRPRVLPSPQGVEADDRPALEAVPEPIEIPEPHEAGVREP
jgi:pimeloyl-ACP methyl ester carboxylesterase